jgi:diaminohydroxyphosphoribosylaminopyrimidine deaminase/5-amino-6-(5-phosphoribosylamino)uracil reductase
VIVVSTARRSTAASDAAFMGRALKLARRGSGETNPNPLVGCVIVRGGAIVGEGFHARAGGDHAERVALRRAGARARGATMYVTLEPCSHHGRTPPCAPQVAAAGIRRVVAATSDPNPRVRGRGFAHLRRAGVRVAEGALAEEARELNRRFFRASGLRRPFVALKVAMTLDGAIATARGESKWITSPAQRRDARALRRLHDAVLVGIETVRLDDPMLLPSPRVRRSFARIVLDTRLRIPTSSRLVRSASRPVIVVCGPGNERRARHLRQRGLTIVPVRTRHGRVDVGAALRELRRLGIWSLMVEGGGEVLGSFLADRLFDEVVIYRAPLLLGGRRSRRAFAGPDPPWLRAAARLRPAPPTASRRPAGVEVWYPATSRA